jgi:hypothetical protein
MTDGAFQALKSDDPWGVNDRLRWPNLFREGMYTAYPDWTAGTFTNAQRRKEALELLNKLPPTGWYPGQLYDSAGNAMGAAPISSITKR